METDQKCRVCGCDDDDCIHCIALTGQPCGWVEPDLCSACAMLKDEPSRKVRIEECLAAAITLMERAIAQCTLHADRKLDLRLTELRDEATALMLTLFQPKPKKRRAVRS